MNDENFASCLADLINDDVNMRVIGLRAAAQLSTGDPRLLPYLEALLDDTTPCVVALPYALAEVRWLAAHALAYLRSVLGMSTPVRLSGVAIPLSSDDLAQLRRGAVLGSPTSGGVEGMLATFAELSALGRLPLADIELDYTVPYGVHYTLRQPSPLQAALADEYAGVSEIVDVAPFTPLVMPAYQLVIRTITCAHEEMEEGGRSLTPPDEEWGNEIILLTGERVPVTVIGTATITHHYDATEMIWSWGAWGPDSFSGVLMIRHSDLTAAQAIEARWLVRRRVRHTES